MAFRPALESRTGRQPTPMKFCFDEAFAAAQDVLDVLKERCERISIVASKGFGSRNSSGAQ
jgi:hypothetical protein